MQMPAAKNTHRRTDTQRCSFGITAFRIVNSPDANAATIQIGWLNMTLFMYSVVPSFLSVLQVRGLFRYGSLRFFSAACLCRRSAISFVTVRCAFSSRCYRCCRSAITLSVRICTPSVDRWLSVP